MARGPLQQATDQVRQFFRRVKNGIIQDVPEDIALCEFDCNKGQCKMEEWEKCKRRLSGAANELKPRV